MIFPLDLKEVVVLEMTDNLKDYTLLQEFIATDEDDLIRYHHNLGRFLRNHYNMWELKGGDKHPDDISFEFIKEIHKQLKVN